MGHNATVSSSVAVSKVVREVVREAGSGVAFAPIERCFGFLEAFLDDRDGFVA